MTDVIAHLISAHHCKGRLKANAKGGRCLPFCVLIEVYYGYIFYYADEKYIDYLKQVEKSIRGFTCVPNTNYGNTNKFLFGAVMSANGYNYYVPVSSYSKNQQDVILIKDKKHLKY